MFGGTPFNHNIIVIRDEAGRKVHEINGGPIGPDGRIIQFTAANPFPYVSGQHPVGAEYGPRFYRQGLPETQLFSGPREEVEKRFAATETCIVEINEARQRYTLQGGPVYDREASTLSGTYNSNSVATTLARCMGLPRNEALERERGGNFVILPESRIQQIMHQHGLATTSDAVQQ